MEIILVVAIVLFVIYGCKSSMLDTVTESLNMNCVACGRSFEVEKSLGEREKQYLCAECAKTKEVCSSCGSCVPKSKMSWIRIDTLFKPFCIECMRKRYQSFRELEWSKPVHPITSDSIEAEISSRPGVYVLWALFGTAIGYGTYGVVFVAESGDLRSEAMKHIPSRERNITLQSASDLVLQYARLDSRSDRLAVVQWLYQHYDPECMAYEPDYADPIVTNLPPISPFVY